MGISVVDLTITLTNGLKIIAGVPQVQLQALFHFRFSSVVYLSLSVILPFPATQSAIHFIRDQRG